FSFQAEDGIRGFHVTGVQTCALPIYGRFGDAVDFERARFVLTDDQELSLRRVQTSELRFLGERPARGRVVLSGARVVNLMDRAEDRKSTRLNSSHVKTSYAVICLKKTK